MCWVSDVLVDNSSIHLGILSKKGEHNKTTYTITGHGIKQL